MVRPDREILAAMDAIEREAIAELGQAPWVLGSLPARPLAIGEVRDIEAIAIRVLGVRGDAFMTELRRWRGPDPYPMKQTRIAARPWKQRLEADDLLSIMRGEACAMQEPGSGRIDLVMRDHHMLDALLFLYDAHGLLPRGPLLHLDRHSDFEPIVAWHGQANGWWSLLSFLRRPDPPHDPIIDPWNVIYGNALELDPSKYDEPIPGELNGAHAQVPPSHSVSDRSLRAAIARASIERPDIVSVDLDLFMPSAQLRIAGEILSDRSYREILGSCDAAIFALSPQFARGGDRVDPVARATNEELAQVLALARAR